MDGARIFTAGPDDEGRRLDRVLRRMLGKASLSLIYSSLRKGLIRVNGAKARPEGLLHEGDRIEVSPRLEDMGEGRAPARASAVRDAEAALAPLVVARGWDLLVLDKPRGMLTHGPESLDTLVRAVNAGMPRESLAFTPGPLHRLDRNTSGLVLFPLTLAGARDFTEALREGRVAKYYLALLSGKLGKGALWEDNLEREEESLTTRVTEEGRTARTRVEPLSSAQGLTLAVLRLETGRTHQIRAQCAHHGHPLAGDSKYGDRGQGPYFLHAWRLDFLAEAHAALPPIVEAAIPEEALARLRATFGAGGLEEILERGRAWTAGPAIDA